MQHVVRIFNSKSAMLWAFQFNIRRDVILQPQNLTRSKVFLSNSDKLLKFYIDFWHAVKALF